MQLTEVPNAVRNLGERVQRSEPVNSCYTPRPKGGECNVVEYRRTKPEEWRSLPPCLIFLIF